MKIVKIINNNIVSAYDEKGREVVVMGRGLGFQKKPGQAIDDKDIEKIFRMETEGESERLKSILADMPIEHVKISNDIISYAKETMNTKLNRNIYITLTDHINFAIERNHEGANYKNVLLWEIKKFYQKEYQIGLHALEMIRNRLNIDLPEDEAGSIALHIINAEHENAMNLTMDMAHFIHEVTNIVKYYYSKDLDENSLHFDRFVTHLKYLAQRIFTGKTLESGDSDFCEMIRNQYKKAYQCAERVSDFIEKEYKCKLTEDEKIYLTVHIRRVVD